MDWRNHDNLQEEKERLEFTVRNDPMKTPVKQYE